MATNPYIAGLGASDARGQRLHGVQIAGKGQVAARGAGLATDATGSYAASMAQDADQTGVVAAASSLYQAGTYLGRILITTAGTAGMTVYDNAGPSPTAIGKVIAIIPANAALGSYIDVRMPVTAGGISFVGGANTPALTFSFA